MAGGGGGASEVEVPLAGLVQVGGASLGRPQQVEAPQRVAAQRLAAMAAGVAVTLLEAGGAGGERRGVARRVERGAPRDGRHLWPAGGWGGGGGS